MSDTAKAAQRAVGLGVLAAVLAEAVQRRHNLDGAVPAQIAAAAEREIRAAEEALMLARAG